LPKVISEKTLRPRDSSAAGVRNNQANGFIYTITFGNCYKRIKFSLFYQKKRRMDHSMRRFRYLSFKEKTLLLGFFLG
jgi:hypothetical protein